MEKVRGSRWTQVLENQAIRPDRGSAAGRLMGLGPLAVVAAGLMASCLLVIWVHVQTLHLRYEVSQAYEENRRLLERQAALEVERQTLRSPKRIAEIAERDLGMHLAEPRERSLLP